MIRPVSIPEKDNSNLYPLWWIIDEEAKQILLDYQKKYYDQGIGVPEKPVAEIPVDWDKETRKAPSRSR